MWLAKFGACAKVPWPWIMPSVLPCDMCLLGHTPLPVPLSFSLFSSPTHPDRLHTYNTITDWVFFFFSQARVFIKLSCISLGNCRQLVRFFFHSLSLSFFFFFFLSSPISFSSAFFYGALCVCWHFVLAAADAADTSVCCHYICFHCCCCCLLSKCLYIYFRFSET